MGFGIFRFDKIKLADGGAIKGRIKHSWREHGDETLDKEKCQYLRGDNAEQIWQNYKKNISELTQSPRSNAVGCLEVVITCSQDSIPKEKQTDFFNDSVKALKKQFGSQNICGMALHHDETAPHLHAFITPIQELENGTKKLNAKSWTGGKQKLVELQNFFHNEVFSKYGLDRGEAAELTHRKNQRPKLDRQEKLLRGKENALNAREKKLEAREKALEKKLEALKPLDKVKNFSPALEALPLAKLPVKKVFESAEKVIQKTAEETLKFAQKQYKVLHQAFKEVSSALGYEKLLNQNLSQDLARSDTIINGMAQELEKHKTALKNLTPEKCDKLAKNMRDSGCQNYGEWEKQEQERIAQERAQKAQERTKTRKRASGMGYER